MDELIREDEEFMKLALDAARLAEEEGEVPVGAVAVRDGKVIAVTLMPPSWKSATMTTPSGTGIWARKAQSTRTRPCASSAMPL